MATTLANLLDKIGTEVSDTTNPTSNNSIRTKLINSICDDMSSEVNFLFAKKEKLFSHIYDAPLNGRGISDVLGITDFKDPDDIRVEDDHNIEFSFERPDYVERLSGIGRAQPYCYAIETLNGKDVLRINYTRKESVSILDTCDTLGENGADWVGSGGASNLATDTDIKKVGDGSVSFDLDASGSATLTKTFTSGNAKDLESLLANASLRKWMYMPTGSGFTSLQLRWGSASGAYYQATATTQHDGTAFKNGWNRLDYVWDESTTKSGSPDLSSIVYVQLTITYTAVAQTGVRIDDLRAIEGTKMRLIYFTDHFVKSGSTLQARFTTDPVTTTETLLAPDDFASALIAGCVWKEMGRKKSWSAKETLDAEKVWLRLRESVLRRHGVAKKKPLSKLKVRSYWG